VRCAVVATSSEPVFLEKLCSNPFQLFHKLESYTPCIHFLVLWFSSQTWNVDTRLVLTRRLMHAYTEQSIRTQSIEILSRRYLEETRAIREMIFVYLKRQKKSRTQSISCLQNYNTAIPTMMRSSLRPINFKRIKRG